MIEVPQDAVEAAAKTLVELAYGSWEQGEQSECEAYMGDARAALDAALPVLEKHIRASIAAEIEAEGVAIEGSRAADMQRQHVLQSIYKMAARVARGEDSE